MKIINSNSTTQAEEPVVVAIGFFDGVHKGHQYLIDQIKKEAQRRSLASAVVTFINHPSEILRPNKIPSFLCGYNEKLERLADAKLNYCFPVEFTYELSQMSACEFMKYLLKDKYNVDTLIIGYDHRFGHERTDDFSKYVEYGKVIGINVIQAQELDTGEYVSSTHIRKLLMLGKPIEAAKLLTYNYNLKGKVVEGEQIGRTIGYPTANLKLLEQEKLVPADGVYATLVTIDNKPHKGMLYVGNRPTVTSRANIYDSNRRIEVHVLDYDRDIYGKTISIDIIQFVRRDITFGGIEILRRQLTEDEKTTRKLLEKFEFDEN